MGLNGRNIVCLASSSWDAMWVNSQHLMSRLARTNRVLYVNNTGLRVPGASRADLRKIGHRIRNFLRGASREQEGLYVLSPIIIPLHRFALVRWLNSHILALYIRYYLKKLGMTDPILWVFLPTGLGLLGRLGEDAVVYHCVDKYSENPGVSTALIEEMDAELCRRADLVITTSRSLYEAQKIYNPATYHFDNVADVDHFSRILSDGRRPPDDVTGIARPIVGYQGNISGYKIDLPLLEKLATARPDWSFVLVGPVGWGDPHTDVRRLRALPNVHFLDRKGFNDLPRYVAAFDVCLIPFNESDVNQNSFPMKFYEYLAVGKPIVSRRLRSLAQFEDQPAICRLASTPDEFIKRIEEALKEDQRNGIVAERLEVAKENSWSRRVPQIGDLVDSLSASRAARAGHEEARADG